MQPQTLMEYLTAGDVPAIVRELSHNQRTCGHDAKIISRADWQEMRTAADAFYDAHSDDWIAHYNLSREMEELREESATRRWVPEEKKRAGYIYLLRAADGHYKIGRAVNVGPRVRQIGTDIPYKVETIHTFHAEDYCAVELELHKRFADKRANGEWFRLDAADVEYICSLGVPAPASD
jgi:hypothetical protein